VQLTPAFKLQARVARVELLRAGDSVSYGRNWVAERPTWTATLPVGHADGYPRRAVEGCEVLIGRRLYPVVGAVSASHTIVVLGDQPIVSVGDVATLVGPDDPAIHPNEVARRTGSSVYDVLMHLGQNLPRVVV
jgi:alanine racemase